MFFFSSGRRHTRCLSDWSSDVCSSDLIPKRGALRGLWKDTDGADSEPGRRVARRGLPLLVPLLPLMLWYAYHYARTGYVFGNPEFFRYNVAATLNPLRFLMALVLRLWQAFGYLHLWLL